MIDLQVHLKKCLSMSGGLSVSMELSSQHSLIFIVKRFLIKAKILGILVK